MKILISEEHMIAAIEGYMKALTMVDDDAIVLGIKRTRNNDYEVEVEQE